VAGAIVLSPSVPSAAVPAVELVAAARESDRLDPNSVYAIVVF
jgi:hypothetical protein